MKFNIGKWFKFEKFRNALVGKTHPQDTKLNGLSIFFLIIFNIFIFMNLSDGMSSQSKNIASPYQYTPYQCSDIFDHYGSSPSKYYRSIESYRDQNITKTIYAPSYDADFVDNKSSFYCQQLSQVVENVQSDTDFENLISDIESLESQLSTAQSQKYQYENQYDNFRDDYSAGLGNYDDRIGDIDEDNIRANYENILTTIDSLESQILLKQSNISQVASIQSVSNYINTHREDYIKDKEKYEYWYPVKVTLLQIILIFPIFLVSLFGLFWAGRKQNKILSILSSNIALISGIFALFILFKIIYWLFPHTLLENIFIFLSSIQALAIWNYVLVIIGVAIFGTLMYFSQKFFDKWKKMKQQQVQVREEVDKEKVMKERFWDTACMKCNTKLLPGAKCCGNCGFAQYDVCTKCKHNSPKCYTHCDSCGTKK